MPSRDGLDLLVRTTPLTPAEWLELIRLRVAAIKPHLDHFTLQCLGNAEYLGRFILPNSFPDLPASTLNWQGLFGICPWLSPVYDRATEPKSDKMIWGLTRNAEWIVVRVTYLLGRGSQLFATKVVVKEVKLEEFLVETRILPHELCRQLSLAVRDFLEAREKLLQEAKGLKAIFDEQDRILSRLPDPT